MFDWSKNWYFTSKLWIGNPLVAFKDIKISAKYVGHTYHVKFSDAKYSYFQSSNYDKQSLKPC